jgi:hypothetical protein
VRLPSRSDQRARRWRRWSDGRRLGLALAALFLLLMEALPLAAALRAEPPRDGGGLSCCRGTVCPMSAAPHRRFAGSTWMPCRQRDASYAGTATRPPIELASRVPGIALADAGCVVDETPSPLLDPPLGVPGRPPRA